MAWDIKDGGGDSMLEEAIERAKPPSLDGRCLLRLVRVLPLARDLGEEGAAPAGMAVVS